MKKVLIGILALIMVFGFVGCSSAPKDRIENAIQLNSENFDDYIDWDFDVYNSKNYGYTFYAELVCSCTLKDGVESIGDIVFNINMDLTQDTHVGDLWELEDDEVTIIIPADENSGEVSLTIVRNATNENSFEYYKENPGYPIPFPYFRNVTGTVYLSDSSTIEP